MKRILMISTHGYFEAKPGLGKPDTGGQVVFVIELSKALAKFGYKVDILTRQFKDLPQIEKINENVQIVRISCGGEKFIPKEHLVNYLSELTNGFIEYSKKNKLTYEFIDAHYWDAGFAGEKLSQEFNIPFLFTPHSLGIWKQTRMKETFQKIGKYDEKKFEKRYNFNNRNRTEKEIMRKAENVIATTPEQKEIIVNEYKIPKEKTVVITPGFNTHKFKKIDEKALSDAVRVKKLPPKFVLTVGRMAQNKGYDLLIKSMKYVLKEVPEAKLLLAIGSRNPPEQEIKQINELKEIARKANIGDKVFFLGHLKDLEYYYNAASVFVLASTYEPFGMTAIEAMACQTPVIATEKGGLKYFLEDGKDSLIVNPFRVKKMANKIVSILTDKKLSQKIAKNGYEKAHSKFTWEIIVKETISKTIITKMKTKNSRKNKKIICTDLDGTFIGDDKAMKELLKLVEQNNIILAFSTGRDLESITDFIKEKKIKNPDACLCLVGTEIYILEKGKLKLEKKWSKVISEKWNKEKIINLLNDIKELAWQEKRWQTDFKISYYLKKNSQEILKEIKRRLKKYNLEVKVVYSANEFLDLLPVKSGKAEALKYLIKKIGVKKRNVVVCGDSGNDTDLFEAGFKGIIVGNAHKELKSFKGKNAYHAKKNYSAGIIEGLEYSDFLK